MSEPTANSAARFAPADVTVAILAGGLGTRLRPAVADRPKVMAEVGGRPFLTRWLDCLAEQGFRRVVLCTGHRAAQVRAGLGTEHRGLSLSYSVETAPLGTGGALRHALPRLTSEVILVLNGDSYIGIARKLGIDLDDLLRASRRTQNTPLYPGDIPQLP